MLEVRALGSRVHTHLHPEVDFMTVRVTGANARMSRNRHTLEKSMDSIS